MTPEIQKDKRIAFIGAGNLATHLAQALYSQGYEIVKVYSRSEESASELAKKVSANYTTSIKEMENFADIYFIALKDSAVEKVLSNFNSNDRLLVHCSGSLSMDVLKNHSSVFGVLYPLQTFSKKRSVDFSRIPVFIEAVNFQVLSTIEQIAKDVSNKVIHLESSKRKSLHIAAVFACNFVNHFYHLAGEVLSEKNVDFDVLRPLIMETAKKVQELNPYEAQTGPAVRFDENIIQSHLEELKGKENYDQIYHLISTSIFEHHKEN